MSKQKIAVLTDSTAYLPENVLDELNIHVIPLTINWGEKVYFDRVDISPNEFYKKLQVEKELPKTSQATVGEFKEMYDALAAEYEGIVAVLLSSGLSGTVDSGLSAQQMMGDFPIEVVDTKVTAAALGLCAIKAAEVARDGGSLDEIAAAAREVAEKQTVMFIVDTLEFLHRGGRIGGAQRLFGSMLAIKPLLHLKDGKIDSLDSVRTKKKAIHEMLSIFEQAVDGHENLHVAIFHGAAEEEAEKIRDSISEKYSPKTLMIMELSPVIGVHTGPGTVAMTYYTE